MFSLISKTIKIYLKHFPTLFKIISFILLPILALRLIAHYSYLGSLTIIYSTIFGVVVGLVGVLVEIVLIKTVYNYITNTKTAETKKELWKSSRARFFPYLILKIFIAIITLSVPFAVEIIMRTVRLSQIILQFLNIITIAWIAGFTLLFIFVPYVFVIKNTRVIEALRYGKHLFLHRGFSTTVQLAFSLAIFAIIFILISSLTSAIIAQITNQTYLLYNKFLSPWWQDLVIEIYAVLSIPVFIVIVTQLFIRVDTLDQNNKKL